jgi:hypothetical protein
MKNDPMKEEIETIARRIGSMQEVIGSMQEEIDPIQ